jgi:hypothetical protein
VTGSVLKHVFHNAFDDSGEIRSGRIGNAKRDECSADGCGDDFGTAMEALRSGRAVDCPSRMQRAKHRHQSVRGVMLQEVETITAVEMRNELMHRGACAKRDAWRNLAPMGLRSGVSRRDGIA